MLLELLSLIVAHGLILGVLILLWKWIRAHEPMTEAHLRRVVVWERMVPSDALPSVSNPTAIAALLRALNHGGGCHDILRALFVAWEQQGVFTLHTAPKKALRSFGADVQLEIRFTQDTFSLDGAQALLCDRIRNWMDVDGTLQHSQIYQAARTDAHTLDNILHQFMYEGQRALRDIGASTIENKKTRFGLATDARELYTQKGIRLARETAVFVRFAQQSTDHLQGQAAILAAFAGVVDVQAPACVMADAVWNGLIAGKQVDSASCTMIQ